MAILPTAPFFFLLFYIIMGPLSFKGWWALVGPPDFIPESEILAIVVIKVYVMVGVMSRAIDDMFQAIWDKISAIVNRDGPDVDEDVENQVSHLVQRKQERVDVIGNALHEAIYGVESMACEWRRDLPEVVGLMYALEEKWAVLVHRLETHNHQATPCPELPSAGVGIQLFYPDCVSFLLFSLTSRLRQGSVGKQAPTFPAAIHCIQMTMAKLSMSFLNWCFICRVLRPMEFQVVGQAESNYIPIKAMTRQAFILY